jgi:hypothetical protein
VPDGNNLQTYNPRDDLSGSTGFSTVSTAPGIADLAKQAKALNLAQSSETNASARTQKLYDYQKFLLSNAVPCIPLPVRKFDWLVGSKRLKNIPVKNPNFFRSYLVDNWYLDPNKP